MDLKNKRPTSVYARCRGTPKFTWPAAVYEPPRPDMFGRLSMGRGERTPCPSAVASARSGRVWW